MSISTIRGSLAGRSSGARVRGDRRHVPQCLRAEPATVGGNVGYPRVHRGRVLFEGENLDIGRPSQVSLVFDPRSTAARGAVSVPASLPKRLSTIRVPLVSADASKTCPNCTELALQPTD